ncbi:MAG: hypothetical protein KBT34_11505 [Prevotella sp.]|nr:hypothetical protein [Candidatus Prevotella equi]
MRKKFGDWILDVAKYLLTVGILAPILNFGNVNSTIYYLFVVGIVIVLLAVGLFLTDESNNSNLKKNKKGRK